MAKKDMKDKIKEGVSVEEIENFARKYLNEVFLVLSFIIATISSIFGFFTGPVWSVLFAGALAIVGIVLPVQVGKILKIMLKMQMKSEKTTMIIIGVVRLVFSIFIPFIIFAELGLLAGHAFHATSKFFDGKDNDNHSDEDEHI